MTTPPTLDELREMRKDIWYKLTLLGAQVGEQLHRLAYVDAEINKRGGYPEDGHGRRNTQ